MFCKAVSTTLIIFTFGALLLPMDPAFANHCKGKHKNDPGCDGGGGPPSDDTTNPGPIEGEVRTQSHTYNGMVLHWVAPGDDGPDEGTVDRYDIRRTNPGEGAACAASPETMDWEAMIDLPLTYSRDASTLKAPFPAHSVENLQVLNLRVETCYDFRLEAFDEADNPSGPTYTTGTTTVALEDSAWGVPEIANVGGNYFSSLAIDPVDGQPAFLIGDYEERNTRYAKRSVVDGVVSWSEEVVESTNCVDGAMLDFSPLGDRNAAGVITRCGKGRRTARVFVERMAVGNWVDTLTLPREYRNFSFAYDTGGLRVLALNLDQNVQLVRLDVAPNSPEVISLQDGHGPWLRFNRSNGLPAVAFEDSDDVHEYANLAEFDGSTWRSEVYKTSEPNLGVDSPAFDFDPNGEPLALSAAAYGFFVARRNADGEWEETSAPLPTIHAIGTIEGMQIRTDGTVFVHFQNGRNITVGRLCESGRGFACEGVWPINSLDTWVWETVTVELSGISTGSRMALDLAGLPAVGWGNENQTLYAHCRPGISQICEPLPSP